MSIGAVEERGFRPPLSPLRHLSPKRHARAARARHQGAFVIYNVAFGHTNGPALLDHPPGCGEFGLPYRLQEIDLQLQRGERLTIIEGAGISNPHGGVGDVAQDPAMQRSHGISVAWPCFQLKDRTPRFDLHQPESNQLRHRCWGRLTANSLADFIDHSWHRFSSRRNLYLLKSSLASPFVIPNRS